MTDRRRRPPYQVEVMVPDFSDAFVSLTTEEQIDAWRGRFHEVAGQLGIEVAKEQYPDWEDWVDETGEVGVPDVDMDIELMRRFNARTAKKRRTPIIVLGSDEEFDEDDIRARLKAMGVPNP